MSLAQSRLTAQSQISVPAEVRRRLGIGPGSTIDWHIEDDTEDAVRKYKSLAIVERAFRCLKGVDLLVRPIHHRTENHVCAHIFVCMLAYYVEWHLRQALAPLLFHDEDLDSNRAQRDPVAPAQPSENARRRSNPASAVTDYRFTASRPCSPNSRLVAGIPPTPGRRTHTHSNSSLNPRLYRPAPFSSSSCSQ